MDKDFDLFTIEIGKLLRGYGQDLAMRGAQPWEQRFGTPEIALVIIPIAGWFIKTVLEVIIETEVKKRLEKKSVEKKISDIEMRLQNIEIVVNQAMQQELSTLSVNEMLRKHYSEVMQQYKSLGKPDDIQAKIHNEELLEILQSVGLTRRKALKLSTEIIEISVKYLSI